MKTAQYAFILLCGLTLFACKQKGKQTVNDAIKTESQTHKETDNTGPLLVSADKLIIAGKSVGEVALNQPAAAVIAQLGKPDVADAAMGKSMSVWYDGHNKKSYTTHIYTSTDMGNDDVARVKVVRVSSPSFKTQNRLYAGVLIAEAQKRYHLEQLGTFKLNGSARVLYDDAAAGIAFDADRSGNITGIAIHEPAKSVLNAYTAFFGEVKGK